MTIRELQPKAVWENFYLLTQVLRPSGHLEKVQEFLLHNVYVSADRSSIKT